MINTIICIASGPSLTRADVAQCEQAGLPLLGVNNVYQITDRLIYHYACDTKYWDCHYPYTQAHTHKYSLQKDNKDQGHPGVKQMERGQREAISYKWPVLGTGGNSGFQAVNLAYLLGYTRIILLGYDMQLTGGQTHWHGDHDFEGATNPVKNTFKGWIPAFNKVAQELKSVGVEVINASRKTALECFPRVSLEEALWS